MDVEHSLWQGLPLVLYIVTLASVFWQIATTGFPEVFGRR